MAFQMAADDEKEPRMVEIAGRWTISESATLDGGQYTGTVAFSERDGIFTVQWRTDTGNYPGLGIRKGNNLFVGWGSEDVGVVVYEIAENGILQGEWAFPGGGGVGTERASPQQNANQLAGRYSVAGANPDGVAQYTGSLLIEQNGDVYQLTWGGNAGPANGVGIRVGDYLVVGYGAPVGGNGVIHYDFTANAATGRWTIDNADGIATENLSK